MEVIRLDQVSLVRRTQEEFSYDLKKTLLSFLEGKYRKPSRRCVLDQIDFVVEAGEKVGIIGANGSGKSTLLKVICNILEPTSGTVRVRGNIAPLIELGAGFDPEISVADNIVLYGVMLGFSEQQMRQRAASILEFAELEDYATVPVKALSSGMVARLGFAIATDIQPDILILDEVLSVGDESFKNKCKQRIEQFWHDNATILLVSHDLSFLQKSCERVIWLERGRIRLAGDAAEVVQAYLDSVTPLQILDSSDEGFQDNVGESENSESELELSTEEIVELEAEVILPTGETLLPPLKQSGSVVVTRLFLTNQTKEIIHTVPFSSPFCVGIEYTVNAPVEKLQFGFHIRDRQDRCILEPATNNWLPLTGAICEPGNHCLYAVIPAPLLVPGEYLIFGMGAYEENVGHHYRLLDYLLRFTVELTPEDKNQWFGQEIVHPTIEWILD